MPIMAHVERSQEWQGAWATSEALGSSAACASVCVCVCVTQDRKIFVNFPPAINPYTLEDTCILQGHGPLFLELPLQQPGDWFPGGPGQPEMQVAKLRSLAPLQGWACSHARREAEPKATSEVQDTSIFWFCLGCLGIWATVGVLEVK